MTKRFGFTLAEVLITLGIIGVVAAMTIPNLIANTNSAKFSAQYKKTISTLNQAALMAQAQYDMNFAGLTEDSAANQSPDTKASLAALLNGTISGGTFYDTIGNLKYDQNGGSQSYTGVKTAVTTFIGAGNIDMNSAYMLADGSLFVFPKAAKNCTVPAGTPQGGNNGSIALMKAAKCYGFIDVNGASLPNKEVSCSTITGQSTTTNPADACTIKKGDSKAVTDIFPVVFHDGVVEPATNAAKVILSQGK